MSRLFIGSSTQKFAATRGNKIISLSLAAIALALQACSSTPTEPKGTDGDNNTTTTTYSTGMKLFGPILGENNVNEATKDVQARASWQDFGIYVKAGSKFTINSTGQWTGGEFDIGSSTANSTILYCDAGGCEGEGAYATSQTEYHFQPFDVLDFNMNYPTNKPQVFQAQRIIFDPANVFSYVDAPVFTKELGYYDGRLDGQSICFGSDNRLIGSETPNIQDGFWASQRRAYESQKATYIYRYGTEDNLTYITFLDSMIAMYATATCSNPVTKDQVMDIVQTAFDGTPRYTFDVINFTVFEPVYRVTVPAGNYKKPCLGLGDTVTQYYYGKPRYLKQYECAPTERSALIMKIVADGESEAEVAPIIAKRNYVTTAFEAPKTGRIYFRNNDSDAGIGNNDGSLSVTLTIAP